VVLREELITKRVKMGLFILLLQDVGLAMITREGSLFVPKERVT